jgi:hypothetical protein
MEWAKTAAALIVLGAILVVATVLVIDRLVVGPTEEGSGGPVADAIDRYGSPVLTEQAPPAEMAPPLRARPQDLIPESVEAGRGVPFERTETTPANETPWFDAWATYMRAPAGEPVTLYVKSVAGIEDSGSVGRAAEALGAVVLTGDDSTSAGLGKSSGTVLIRNRGKGLWGLIWINDGFLFAVVGAARGEVEDFVELYPY